MKNILTLYAKYNKDTNNKIIRILSGLGADELKSERNSYYKCMNDLFNHLVIGEWHYLNAMSYICGIPFNTNLHDRDKTLQRIESSFTEAATILQELDECLINFINEITEDDLNIKKNNMKIYNGRVVDISVWQYMTQHITHQIHHQGQLSQILDEMKIEHEFGNIFPYVSDSLNRE